MKQGQGQRIKDIGIELRELKWSVVHLCIPNTPHIGVVPIPIINGTSRQRYPDILAFKDGITLLIEVEISLSKKVVSDILHRFEEQINSLYDKKNWISWTSRISEMHGIEVPKTFNPVAVLGVVKQAKLPSDSLFKELSDKKIILLQPNQSAKLLIP